MQKPGFFILCFFLSVSSTIKGQKAEVIQNYIITYKDLAIAEMHRTGVPAAITLAQGIHESGAGQGRLVLMSNNHFGIKCKSSWTGETVRHNDDAKGECFRKYARAEDSYTDHSDFLKNSQRYAFLFELDPADYIAWANGLKMAGYATNPKYPQILIKLIEDYQLQQYTFIGLGKLVSTDSVPISPVTTVEMPQEKKPVEKKDSSEIAAAPKTEAYPAGIFRLHDTKVVFVKEGTSYLSIAREYEVDLSKIFDFNDMVQAEQTEKDQLVYLQRKRKTGLKEFHIVQPGETLHDIAQQNAIRLESVRELNWLKENEMPAAGEKLCLKSKATKMPRLALKENYSLVPGIK
jgi:LysM repeat protein